MLMGMLMHAITVFGQLRFHRDCQMMHDVSRLPDERSQLFSFRSKGGSIVQIRVTVNGTVHESDVEPRTLLVHYVREAIGLTGTNIGCDTSSCGACSLHLDGEAVKSCTVLAVQADGANIVTIEGMANADGTMHPMQQAFMENHGLQCGYCTPGMVMAATSFLKENPNPTEAEVRLGLEGNLCRCTGYHNIVQSVMACAAGK